MKTLDLINQTRTAFDLEPLAELLPGERHDSKKCPLAMSLKDISSDIYVEFDHAGFPTAAVAARVSEIWEEGFAGIDSVYLPTALKQFVGKFDNGHYPKYDKQKRRAAL